MRLKAGRESSRATAEEAAEEEGEQLEEALR